MWELFRHLLYDILMRPLLPKVSELDKMGLTNKMTPSWNSSADWTAVRWVLARMLLMRLLLNTRLRGRDEVLLDIIVNQCVMVMVVFPLLSAMIAAVFGVVI